MGVNVAQNGLILDGLLPPGVQLAAVRHDIPAVNDHQIDELVDRIELRKRLVRRFDARGFHAELRLEMLHDAVHILRLHAVEIGDRLHGEKAQGLGGSIAGVLGMFLGVPIMAVLRYLVMRTLKQRLQERNVKDLKRFHLE